MGRVREVSGTEWVGSIQTGEDLLQLKGAEAASFRGMLPRNNVTPRLPELSIVLRGPNPESVG